MKYYIRRILEKLLLPVIKKLNYSKEVYVNQLDKNYLIGNLISIMKTVNYEPKFLIDVGANHGSWSRVWKESYPNCKFILIEPQDWLESSFKDLLDANTIYLPIGAGKQNGSLSFTINADRDDSSSFALTSEEAKLLGYQQIEVPVKTLNTIIEENGNNIPDIVKIDAEGIDIDVLDGATHLIGETEIFFVEACINGGFKETDLVKVLNYMDKHGYRAFELTDINRPFQNNILWLVEIAFIRKGGFFDNIKWA